MVAHTLSQIQSPDAPLFSEKCGLGHLEHQPQQGLSEKSAPGEYRGMLIIQGEHVNRSSALINHPQRGGDVSDGAEQHHRIIF